MYVRMNYTNILLFNGFTLSLSLVDINQVLQFGVISLSLILSILKIIKDLKNGSK